MFQPDRIIVNETYPSDCISFKVLLPINLIKFQVPNDSSDSGARKQHPLEATYDPGSKPVVAYVESRVDSAKENQGEDEQQAIVSRGSPSCATADYRENKDVATDFKRQEGDELDIVMAEVQETADLVMPRSSGAFMKPLTFS
jgi:hypothetical protein